MDTWHFGAVVNVHDNQSGANALGGGEDFFVKCFVHRLKNYAPKVSGTELLDNTQKTLANENHDFEAQSRWVPLFFVETFGIFSGELSGGIGYNSVRS